MRMTAEAAAKLVKSRDVLDYGITFNQPDAFDRALAARKGELRGITIRDCLSMRPRAVPEADPDDAVFRCFNWDLPACDRRKHDAGLCRYIPCNLGDIPEYHRPFVDRIDIAIIKAAPRDADGGFNIGLTSLWHRAVLEREARAKRLLPGGFA